MEQLYHVAYPGSSALGPWPLSTILQKIQQGELPQDCVVFTPGMAVWQPISRVVPGGNTEAEPSNLSWNMANAFVTCLFRKYADFSGRASRAEYWWFTLTQILIYLPLLVLCFIDPELELMPLPLLLIYLLYIFLTFIPNLAVKVRRLHDIGKGGWWVALEFVPCVGYIASIIIFVFTCMPGTGPNMYGVAASRPQK